MTGQPPLFTITTDFGTRDGYVGAMKGHILSEVPGAQIVDITHDIPPQNFRTGAWTLKRAVPHYPAETIHIAVVDPGVGSQRAPLLVRHNQQWLLGPDNGLLSLCWEDSKPEAVYRLHKESQWWHSHQSFDGLKLFAPAACCIARGIAAVELGVRQIQYQELTMPQAMTSGDTLFGEVLHADQFGNAITNVRLEDLRPFASQPFQIRCGERSFAMADHYADSESGRAICIVNSDNLLELATPSGSAMALFNLRVGELVMVQPLGTAKPDG